MHATCPPSINDKLRWLWMPSLITNSGKETWIVPILILLVTASKTLVEPSWSAKQFPKLWVTGQYNTWACNPTILTNFSLLFFGSLHLQRCQFFDVSSVRSLRLTTSFTSPFRLTSPPQASPGTPYAAHAVAVLSTRPAEIWEGSEAKHHTMSPCTVKNMGTPTKFDERRMPSSDVFKIGRFRWQKKGQKVGTIIIREDRATELRNWGANHVSQLLQHLLFIPSSLRWLAGNWEWQKPKQTMVTFYGHRRLLESQKNVVCLF